MAIINETSVNLASHVRDVLNNAGGNVGNDLRSFFTSSAKLNMWSKYKPVVISNVNFINLWDNSNYKAGGTCGLNIPFYSTYTSLQSAFKNNSGHYWSYTPPTGGSAQPQRIGDFRRYNTNAINPIGAIPGTLAVTRTGSSDSLSFSVEVVVQSGNTHNLSLTDFTVNGIQLSNMYLGVYLVRKSGGLNDYFKTSTTTIGSNGSLSFNIPLSYGEGGTFIAYPFLSSVVQGTSLQNGTLLSLNKGGTEVKIVSAGTTYILGCSGNAVTVGGKTLYYEVYIKNNGGSSVTFTNIYVRIQHYINGTWQNEGNAYLVSSSKTVSAGSSTTISGTLTHSVAFSLNDLESGYFRIYAYSSSPSVTGDPSPIEAPAP